MEKKLNIVNSHLKFRKVSLIEPSESYYLHVAAEIDHSPLPIFLSASMKKRQVMEQAKKWCGKVKQEEGVLSAVVFKASIIPPGKGKFLQERQNEVPAARYDFAMLIEANSADKIENIRSSDGYKEMENAIKSSSTLTHIVSATNIRHINPVNHNKSGVFLFNYFFADNLQQNLAVWEYTAGWFQQETGLDNSTVLLPGEPQKSKYTIINHCRRDKMSDILPSLLFKKSFHSYVLDNFYANNVAAMPVLYKMVSE